jgi:hypothetical protein
MRIGRGNWSTQRNLVQFPTASPQIPFDMIWDRTRAVAVGFRRLTAWVRAQPYLLLLRYIFLSACPFFSIVSRCSWISLFCITLLFCMLFPYVLLFLFCITVLLFCMLFPYVLLFAYSVCCFLMYYCSILYAVSLCITVLLFCMLFPYVLLFLFCITVFFSILFIFM